MSAGRHSPGQWLAVGPRVYMAEKPGSLIATVGYLLDGRVETANARLIAAAPDLLEALTELEAAAEMGERPSAAALQAARAAVAKATGKPQ